MIISDWSVNNRVTVFFLTFILIAAGTLCYFILPRESSPDIPIPYVFITTNYSGGSPEDIEKLITIPIEDKLKGISGIKEIKSISEYGLSLISIEFTTSTDIDKVLPKVKDKVDLAKVDLPNDLENDPEIEEMNFSEFPILVLGLSGNFGARQLGKLADNLKDSIEGITGVLEVELAGKVDREIHVEIYPERLSFYNIPLERLGSIIQEENLNVSGGSIKLSQGRFQLRVPGEFSTPEEANSLVVAMHNGSPVYLRDIGYITDGLKDRDTDSRVNGQSAITMSVKKQSEANVIEIVEKIKALIAQKKETWPRGLRITTIMDNSEDIRDLVSDLENNILSGLVLVIITVCVAMGLRNAVIVSLSIPLSMLISFIILKMLDIDLNMVVLFSLTLALGMLVDNAIVIVENIYRFMQEGVPRGLAAKKATSEVAWPIIGSALTTIAAFVPLLWWTGIMGEFMVFLPKTIIITLISCLFVAMVINPAIAATVMKAKRKHNKREKPQVALDRLNSGEPPLLSGGNFAIRNYRRVLSTALDHRFKVLIISAGFVVIMMQLWFLRIGITTPVELFPSPDPDNIYVNFNMPQGCGLTYADNLVKKVAQKLYNRNQNASYEESIAPKKHLEKHSGKEYWSPSFLPNIKYTYEKSSFKPGQQFFGQGSDNQIGIRFVDLAERTEPGVQTMHSVEELTHDIAGTEITVEEAKEGPPTGKPINIEISGSDFKTLGKIAEEIKERIKKIPFTQNIRSDYESGSPTMSIKVDRKKAAYLGLSTNYIGYVIRAAFNGAKVSKYREGDDKYDFVVRFDEKNRRVLDTLRQILIVTQEHGKVPLTTIADIEYIGGLGRITRIDNNRVVTVSADVDKTKTTGSVAMRKAINALQGSYFITDSQIPDWDSFLKKLQEITTAATPGMQSINMLLNSNTRDLITSKQTAADLTQHDKAAIVHALNEIISNPALYKNGDYRTGDFSAEIAEILKSGEEVISYLPPQQIQHLNRSLLENSFAGTLDKTNALPLNMPAGYNYTFTGENEQEQESTEFLSIALSVALMLILFVLVAQFNSIAYPIVIMSAVLLSLGGAFLGLGIAEMPFGIIMTGVGIISLAGVVVNNAIVLVDYTLQLLERGMRLKDALIAAGATRFRPVLLTACTTILGLTPMATGYSFDFHNMEFISESESSQWWSSMAIPVIFGLLIATILTLVVVPVLFSLITSAKHQLHCASRNIHKFNINCGYKWFRVYDIIFRTDTAREWKTEKIHEFIIHDRSLKK